MARTLLINPSFFQTYGSNEGGIAFPVYPVLGIASIAGECIQRGHEVEFLDLSYRKYDSTLIADTIRRFRPDIVGVTATTPLINQARDISYIVKDISPEILTIAGGPHPAALPEQTLRESALDLVAGGEADLTIARLLDGNRPHEVSGLHWLDGSVARTSGPSSLIEDLDHLPLPAWEIYPREGNKRVTKLIARDLPVTTIEFSRGCIYSCDFCGSKNTLGRGYRKKSPERCAEEMVRLARLGFREAILVDDIFTSDVEWAAAVCEEIIRRDPGVSWSCTNGIRVDSATPELFELLRRAGCYRLYFGLESGSDEVLQAFGKGGRATLECAVDATRMARKAGLEPNGYFMVGLTGDTEVTMQDTIDFARRVELDMMKCGICVPFPGTPMFSQLCAEGRMKTFDWDQYTVYNDAESLFDHPNLEWGVIRRYFKRFYAQAYFRNPRYLWRRLRYALRTGELLWTAFYTIKFTLMMWGPKQRDIDESYAFEDVWRPLDLKNGDNIEAPRPERSRRGGGPGGRDGVVTVVVKRPEQRSDLPVHNDRASTVDLEHPGSTAMGQAGKKSLAVSSPRKGRNRRP